MSLRLARVLAALVVTSEWLLALATLAMAVSFDNEGFMIHQYSSVFLRSVHVAKKCCLALS